eukprot:8691150-Heterocapsa_arctica.AAC.1
MPVRKRNGLRRQPPTGWQGDFHQFAEGDSFRLEQLIEAYEGATTLGQSVVMDEMMDDNAETHYVEQVLSLGNGGPPAGPPLVLGPSVRGTNPFAALDLAAVSENAYWEQSAAPVNTSSGEETILPGWVRTIGGQ